MIVTIAARRHREAERRGENALVGRVEGTKTIRAFPAGLCDAVVNPVFSSGEVPTVCVDETAAGSL